MNDLTRAIIAAAIEVHRQLGPGLLESVYQVCLVEELRLRQIAVALEVPVPIVYEGVPLERKLYLDLLVAGQVIVETKATEHNSEVHAAQLLTYLKLSDRRLGLVLNFGRPTLTEGIRRVVDGL